MATIASRAKSYGLDGAATLRTLLSSSVKMIEKLPQLAARVTSLTTKRQLMALVDSVKGARHSKRDVVAASL